MNWLQTKNWTKSPQNLRLKNWPKNSPKWIGWGPKTEQNHLKISDAEIGQKETPEFCCCWWKTAVTYKCQKRFLRCLNTYKCQSELVVNQKLNKITSESKTQKLANKQSKMNYLGTKNWTKSPQNLRLKNWPKRNPRILLLVEKNSEYL